jgi:hypothetical protein
VIALASAAFFVVAAISLAAFVIMREPKALGSEREPNDDAAHANRIETGTPVTGYLGQRQSVTTGDKDTFVVPWSPGTHRLVTVKLGGLPNLDVNLSVNDGDGLHGTTVDDGGIGEGEVLHRRSIDGSLVVTVAQTLAKDQRYPVENVSDPYTLEVIEEREGEGEVEPNGTEADANALELTNELRGYLDSRQDVDVLRWTGPDGAYHIVVRTDGTLPLAWRVGDSRMRTPGAASITLKRGDVIRLERTDRADHGSLVGRDVMWSVVITP